MYDPIINKGNNNVIIKQAGIAITENSNNNFINCLITSANNASNGEKTFKTQTTGGFENIKWEFDEKPRPRKRLLKILRNNLRNFEICCMYINKLIVDDS